MNVGIVIQYNFPAEREVRTRKFAKVLDERGNDVTVYSRNTTRDPARGTVKSELDPRTERLEYADVHRFTWFARTRFGHVVTAALPFNPFWVLWLLIQFYRDDIDRLVACELRAGLPTIVAGKLLGPLLDRLEVAPRLGILAVDVAVDPAGVLVGGAGDLPTVILLPGDPLGDVDEVGREDAGIDRDEPLDQRIGFLTVILGGRLLGRSVRFGAVDAVAVRPTEGARLFGVDGRHIAPRHDALLRRRHRHAGHPPPFIPSDLNPKYSAEGESITQGLHLHALLKYTVR